MTENNLEKNNLFLREKQIRENQQTYLNVFARNLGTGPVKLLKDKSLDHEKKKRKKCTHPFFSTHFIRFFTRVLKFKHPFQRDKKKICVVGERLKELYRNASCVMLARDEGIAPERLLLFSLLIRIQDTTIRIILVVTGASP